MVPLKLMPLLNTKESLPLLEVSFKVCMSVKLVTNPVMLPALAAVMLMVLVLLGSAKVLLVPVPLMVGKPV